MKSVLVILLCVLVLLQVRLWLGPGSIADIARLENDIAKQGDENDHLRARNSVLMDDVSDLRNGLDSIEERARNELGLIRQGETFYLILDKDPNARQSPPIDDAIRSDERVLEATQPETPPDIPEDDNPYLDIFRDDEGASDQAGIAEPQAPAAGLAAGQ